MKDMKLGVKLIGGFLVVALVTMAVGYIGITRIRAIEKAQEEMYEEEIRPMTYVSNLSVGFQKTRGSVRDVIMNKFLFGKEISSDISKIKELDEKRKENSEKLAKAISTQEARKGFEALKTEVGQYIPFRDNMIKLAEEGNQEEAQKLLQGEVYVRADKIALSLDKLSEVLMAQVGEKMQENRRAAGSAVFLAWIIVGVGTLLALSMGIFLSLSITRPINRIIEGLIQGTDQVVCASGEISSASQSLAEGASEQAASIEETSSSLEEMSSMTKQNADNANQANSLMRDASQVVNQADESMRRVTGSMEEISRASEETSKIIKTIDEIAFQTNLLALNAAVEAARAGEAGAGFAVVAGEVRNLAMRAADAAKNTANLIEGTVKKVKDGSHLVSKTNEAFTEVAKSAAKVGELVAEIAAATNEQTQGIDQVNKAVAEMDKVVQQNAAGAEESATAAEEMNAQAEQMKKFVRELVSVVGGSGTVQGSVMSRITAKHKPLMHQAIHSHMSHEKSRQDVAKGRELVLQKTGEAMHHGKEVRPAEVIHMNENGFQDF